MKLFINHIDKEILEKKLESVKHIDFSLFAEDIPKNQDDLSSINILLLFEPNEYFGLHDWAIQNQHLFQVILTWSDKVLNNCKNAIYLPFTSTWFTPEQYKKNHKKQFEVAHLCGKLLKTYGQSLRHELLARKDEIKIPTKFYDVYGDRYNVEDAKKGKEFIFGNSMFGAVIENTSYRGYFTEKILDCFLMKTIPIYWGCPNIGDFFNKEGIIKFENIDDFIYISNNLTPDLYFQYSKMIEDNYQIAIQNTDYYSKITNKVEEIFKYNNLI
jgi:hypothetical protein